MNNLRQCLNSLKPTRALLSVKPNFAEAIIRGKKKYEFRRSIFVRPVDVVLIYATVPVRRVVAEFDVCSVISDTLPTLWKRTQKFAGIDSEFFWEYFEGRDYGHAIEIGDVRPYKTPFCPIKELGVRPPQSFVYLESMAAPYLQTIRDLLDDSGRYQERPA
ncbi:MAG: hypothetical protein KAV87_52600 [Desulfobacteraceae bacterium]|nr:hypothetical protein [Desulfobacteraceae bacterium]